MSGQEPRGSAGDYQADDAGRCREAQLAIFSQMIGQVSRGSGGDYQADERAGITRLSGRLSGR